jgi:hypothetical protein
MVRRPSRSWATVAALLLYASSAARAEPARVNTIDELFGRLRQCWQPPKLPEGHPGMQITVLFMLRRDGEIFGKPKITFESPKASAEDSTAYRLAVMETLQRCTPMPFTEGMGGAIAGRTIRFRFDDRRNNPKPVEKRAWLLQKIL